MNPKIESDKNTERIEIDAAIIGGGFGAVAAAQALLARGFRVAMTEEYEWIGGQVTSQALCVLDEYHDPIGEGIGYSRRYAAFREALRDHYRTSYRLSELGKSQRYFNPGNCMDSACVADPVVAHQVILDSFRPFLETKQLVLRTGFVPCAAERDGQVVAAVTLRKKDGANEMLRIAARFFLSGDETGELFPILGIGYRLGAEAKSEFGEAHAPDEANRNSVQSFTHCFVVDYVPGGNFTIPKPADYDAWKKKHGEWFFLGAPGATPADPSLLWKSKIGRGGLRIPPAFYYRATVDCRNFEDPKLPHSRTVINVNGNDYHYENFIEHPDREKVLERGKALSRAYLYWLQTEAPRDDGGLGYPEIRPAKEVTGTEDGFAMAPYIREGRRLKACATVVEEDISTASRPLARAKNFDDSVGLGCFLIDIHARVGAGGLSQMARPYQIPLGALVSPELSNFAVASKCIGVTQISNGAYRLHNVEWAIGEAAGELAGWCLERKPIHPRLRGPALFDFQRRLVRSGIPLYWYEDQRFDDPSFEAAQILALKNILPGHPKHLRFDGYYSIARIRKLFTYVCRRLSEANVDMAGFEELHQVVHNIRKEDMVRRLLALLDQNGWPEFAFDGFPSVQTSLLMELFNDHIPDPLDEDARPDKIAVVK